MCISPVPAELRFRCCPVRLSTRHEIYKYHNCSATIGLARNSRVTAVSPVSYTVNLSHSEAVKCDICQPKYRNGALFENFDDWMAQAARVEELMEALRFVGKGCSQE